MTPIWRESRMKAKIFFLQTDRPRIIFTTGSPPTVIKSICSGPSQMAVDTLTLSVVVCDSHERKPMEKAIAQTTGRVAGAFGRCLSPGTQNFLVLPVGVADAGYAPKRRPGHRLWPTSGSLGWFTRPVGGRDSPGPARWRNTRPLGGRHRQGNPCPARSRGRGHKHDGR